MASMFITIRVVALENRQHSIASYTLVFINQFFVLVFCMWLLQLVSVEMGRNAIMLTLLSVQGVPIQHQAMVAIILVLWVSALVSAFTNNIPFTTAMVSSPMECA